MSDARSRSFEDPLSWIPRIANKLNSLWLCYTYPFASVSPNVSIHRSCELRRVIARHIKIGRSVVIHDDARLDIHYVPIHNDPMIILDENCVIGRRVTIVAASKIHIQRNVLFGPSALVMDHLPTFGDPAVPICGQGLIKGGTITIEEGCWIGFSAAIVCDEGELVIGRHSVIGANSVVTHSVPPFSVVAGNPGKIVKQYDPLREKWVLGPATTAAGRSGA